MEDCYKYTMEHFKYVNHKLKERNQNLYTTLIRRTTCHFEILYQLLTSWNSQWIVGNYDTGRIQKEWSYHH